MRHRKERAGREPPLDRDLDLVGEFGDRRRAQLGFRHLVESLFVVRHGDHGAQGEDFVRVVRTLVRLVQRPRQRLAVAADGVPATPRRISDEGVEEHALQFGIRHGRGRALLREERRWHADVCKVGRVACLMHEGVQRGVPRADSRRVGEGGEVRHCGLPAAIGLDPRGLRPVAEAVRVLALAVEEVERHLRAGVRDAEGRKGAAPLLDGLLEWEVRVELLGDRPGHHVRAVPRLEGGVALLFGEARARLEHQRARSRLEGVEDFKEGLLAEALGLGDLVVVVVGVSKRLGHSVARLNELDETI